jgi:hypothetical protein
VKPLVDLFFGWRHRYSSQSGEQVIWYRSAAEPGSVGARSVADFPELKVRILVNESHSPAEKTVDIAP